MHISVMSLLVLLILMMILANQGSCQNYSTNLTMSSTSMSNSFTTATAPHNIYYDHIVVQSLRCDAGSVIEDCTTADCPLEEHCIAMCNSDARCVAYKRYSVNNENYEDRNKIACAFFRDVVCQWSKTGITPYTRIKSSCLTICSRDLVCIEPSNVHPNSCGCNSLILTIEGKDSQRACHNEPLYRTCCKKEPYIHCLYEMGTQTSCKSEDTMCTKCEHSPEITISDENFMPIVFGVAIIVVVVFVFVLIAKRWIEKGAEEEAERREAQLAAADTQPHHHHHHPERVELYRDSDGVIEMEERNTVFYQPTMWNHEGDLSGGGGWNFKA